MTKIKIYAYTVAIVMLSGGSVFKINAMDQQKLGQGSEAPTELDSKMGGEGRRRPDGAISSSSWVTGVKKAGSGLIQDLQRLPRDLKTQQGAQQFAQGIVGFTLAAMFPALALPIVTVTVAAKSSELGQARCNQLCEYQQAMMASIKTSIEFNKVILEERDQEDDQREVSDNGSEVKAESSKGKRVGFIVPNQPPSLDEPSLSGSEWGPTIAAAVTVAVGAKMISWAFEKKNKKVVTDSGLDEDDEKGEYTVDSAHVADETSEFTH